MASKSFTATVTGPVAGPLDAGAGNTYGNFCMKMTSSGSDCQVNLETSPDNTTWTAQTHAHGNQWVYAASDHRQRYARVNVVNMGTNGTGLAAPGAPVTATAATGGQVAAGTYQVVETYLTANGETIQSIVTPQVTAGATSTLTANSPASVAGATGWNCYISQPGGSTLTLQNTAPIPIGTNFTLTAPPTASGPTPPTGGLAAVITANP